MSTRPYHHGDLRRALLRATAEAIEQHGPAALSLRDLARRAGVSHAAPAHHFGDKPGLLTAFATEGYEQLADALESADEGLLAAGLAYVGFATGHRAHFEVMFRPDLYHHDDPRLTAAQDRSDRGLARALATVPAEGRHEEDGGSGACGDDAGPGTEGHRQTDALAAWSLVHGFATLWLSGSLPAGLGEDPQAAALPVLQRLFAPR